MLTRMQGLMGRLAKDGYKRASRLEKKADLLIKGYQVRVAQCRLGVWWLHAVAATQVRSQGVLGRIHSLAEQVEQVETQLKCFTVVILGVQACVFVGVLTVLMIGAAGERAGGHPCAGRCADTRSGEAHEEGGRASGRLCGPVTREGDAAVEAGRGAQRELRGRCVKMLR